MSAIRGNLSLRLLAQLECQQHIHFGSEADAHLIGRLAEQIVIPAVDVQICLNVFQITADCNVPALTYSHEFL